MFDPKKWVPPSQRYPNMPVKFLFWSWLESLEAIQRHFDATGEWRMVGGKWSAPDAGAGEGGE